MAYIQNDIHHATLREWTHGGYNISIFNVKIAISFLDCRIDTVDKSLLRRWPDVSYISGTTAKMLAQKQSVCVEVNVYTVKPALTASNEESQGKISTEANYLSQNV